MDTLTLTDTSLALPSPAAHTPEQVRPNEFVRFKAITLEEAFSAVFRTDALVEALTAVARGNLSLQQAQQQLDNFKVWAQGLAVCCTLAAVLQGLCVF
jgi:hypothetical protein